MPHRQGSQMGARKSGFAAILAVHVERLGHGRLNGLGWRGHRDRLFANAPEPMCQLIADAGEAFRSQAGDAFQSPVVRRLLQIFE